MSKKKRSNKVEPLNPNLVKSSYVPPPACHTGTIQVFTDPATQQLWYAGGTSHKFETPSDACLVALASNALDLDIFGNIPLLPKQVPTVFLNWHDGGIAPLKILNDWNGLLRALRATNLPIAAACVGGHGRTGTFLAIMAWLMGLPQKEGKQPVEFIRSVYCKECVETKVQFEQIKLITGEDETKLFVPFVSNYPLGGYQTYGGKPYVSLEGNYNKEVIPADQNKKLKWFWGLMPGGKYPTKYEGYPSSTGKWVCDSAGWFWEWDGIEKPTYTPITQEDSLDNLDEFDTGNSNYLNGYYNDGWS